MNTQERVQEQFKETQFGQHCTTHP